jgi:hypothetical protein
VVPSGLVRFTGTNNRLKPALTEINRDNPKSDYLKTLVHIMANFDQLCFALKLRERPVYASLHSAWSGLKSQIAGFKSVASGLVRFSSVYGNVFSNGLANFDHRFRNLRWHFSTVFNYSARPELIMVNVFSPDAD